MIRKLAAEFTCDEHPSLDTHSLLSLPNSHEHVLGVSTATAMEFAARDLLLSLVGGVGANSQI